MIYLFSKEACGPCILVKKLMDKMNDPRIDAIEVIGLDEGCSQETLDFAKSYTVTATPVMIVTDETGKKQEEYVGGVEIAGALTNGVLDNVR
jgi:thioredoxin-related protein